MNYKTFNLIDTINELGLKNFQWSIKMYLEETDTRKAYGTRESFMLPAGVWVSVLDEKSNEFPFRGYCKPDHTVDYDANNVILFYEAD